eukprot:9316895-Karenia_brevis.AAC.1
MGVMSKLSSCILVALATNGSLGTFSLRLCVPLKLSSLPFSGNCPDGRVSSVELTSATTLLSCEASPH